MKYTIKNLLLCTFAAMLAVSCNDIDEEVKTPSDETFPDVWYEIVSKEEFTAQEFADLLCTNDATARNVDEVVEDESPVDLEAEKAEFLRNHAEREMELANEMGVNGSLTYETFVINYKSINYKGEEVIVSGKIGKARFATKSIMKNIVVVNHDNIGDNNQVPSKKKSKLSSLAQDYNLVIFPDYVGYGTSVKEIHPYLMTERSEERRVGKECLRPCSSWSSLYHSVH